MQKVLNRFVHRRRTLLFSTKIAKGGRTGESVTLYSLTPWTGFALIVMLLFSIFRGSGPGPSSYPRPSRGVPVIAVWNSQTSTLHELPLEEYVRGVVAAEVPAGFHPEALKAQAVAARTYALRRIERDERVPGRSQAHVTTDHRTHQAWTGESDFIARRPAGVGEQQWATISAAVDATRGMVLTYEGQLIDALYHSTSGGHTEDAAHYFSSPVPYLQGVPDPYGDHSPVHRSRTSLSVTTVLNRLGIGQAAGRGSTSSLIRITRRTPSGRVAEVTVAGRTFSGRQLREALGLSSNWFDIEFQGEMVVFHVRGSGHGVGMSQYGADGMARRGFSYERILAHYYRGTRLVKRY